ncbi:hypothetical protein CG719_30775 [Streptomyces sp. CB01373]|nr:hypothetical protein CG719_30775 [Streptomyces sp. CB01373]
MSRSITQPYFQQRFRQHPNASWGDRHARYPYESGWDTGSTRLARCLATTIQATRSATAGTPSILGRPPCCSGISTHRAGNRARFEAPAVPHRGRQRPGAAFTGDKCTEHDPIRYAEEIRDHAGQFGLRVLESLVE